MFLSFTSNILTMITTIYIGLVWFGVVALLIFSSETASASNSYRNLFFTKTLKPTK